MPGASHMGDDLAALVKSGAVSMKKVNDSMLRILTPMFQMRLFDVPNNNSITNNVTSEKHNQIARQLAARATVLLQNNVCVCVCMCVCACVCVCNSFISECVCACVCAIVSYLSECVHVCACSIVCVMPVMAGPAMV